MSEVNNIPKHWQIKKLGDVADYLNGRAFKPTEWETSGKPIIRIQNLNKATAIYNYTKLEFEDKYKVVRGDLLYAWSASLGVYIWKGDLAWLNQHIFKVVPKSICDKKYLFYSLEKITAELYAKAHGSGMVHVTKGKFEETNIPLPPLPEQQAIVSKIEELLSELENGKQQLQIAQQQLKVYRQSLLKWAFEGKLTYKNVREGELPKGWKWVKFIDLCKLQRGYDLPLKNLVSGKYPVVTSSGIKGYHNEYRADGPCLITGRSGGVGNIHFIKVDKYWPHNTSLFVKDFCNNVPEFVYYFFMQFNFKSFGASTTIPTLDRKQLYNEILNLPPIKEQQLIVDELESKLTVCDKIEETISQSLQQAETLRQSILKKAFEGKLL